MRFFFFPQPQPLFLTFFGLETDTDWLELVGLPEGFKLAFFMLYPTFL